MTYHLTVVELPNKYPGTLFGIHDARTNSLQSDTWPGGTEVVKYDDRGTAQSEINRIRRGEAIRALLKVVKEYADISDNAKREDLFYRLLKNTEMAHAVLAEADAINLRRG